MTIQKNIIGTLEVDPSSNKIWLNTIEGKCVLRIGGIEFTNILQKFEQLDIYKDSGFMIKGVEIDSESKIELTSFIFRLVNLFYINLSYNTTTKIDKDEYERLYKYIVKYFNKEEGVIDVE